MIRQLNRIRNLTVIKANGEEWRRPTSIFERMILLFLQVSQKLSQNMRENTRNIVFQSKNYL